MELARNLKIDSVSRLLPSRPLTLERDATVAAAVALMRKHRVGCLLVCDNKKLVGVFTERDLLRRVIAVGRPFDMALTDAMTPNPVTVSGKDPIRLAIKRMEQGGYRHLPVVDETDRPVGILSVKRIVHYLVEHFPRAIYTLPPDPKSFPMHPEGA